MENRQLNKEINVLSDRLARLVERFNRSYNMTIAVEITETRRLLREKKEKLAQVETVGPY